MHDGQEERVAVGRGFRVTGLAASRETLNRASDLIKSVPAREEERRLQRQEKMMMMT